MEEKIQRFISTGDFDSLTGGAARDGGPDAAAPTGSLQLSAAATGGACPAARHASSHLESVSAHLRSAWPPPLCDAGP